MKQRIIKFRAWFEIRGKGGMNYDLVPGNDYPDSFDGELMQYTGLIDKNGEEIYEGDIVEFNYDPLGSFREEIIFDDGGFWTKRKDGSRFMPSIEFREVIGNIYENKDLLK